MDGTFWILGEMTWNVPTKLNRSVVDWPFQGERMVFTLSCLILNILFSKLTTSF